MALTVPGLAWQGAGPPCRTAWPPVAAGCLPDERAQAQTLTFTCGSKSSWASSARRARGRHHATRCCSALTQAAPSAWTRSRPRASTQGFPLTPRDIPGPHGAGWARGLGHRQAATSGRAITSWTCGDRDPGLRPMPPSWSQGGNPWARLGGVRIRSRGTRREWASEEKKPRRHREGRLYGGSGGGDRASGGEANPGSVNEGGEEKWGKPRVSTGQGLGMSLGA